MSLTMTMPIHKPVLISEAVEALHAQPGKRYIDCTLGSGGHAAAILKQILPGGQLLGIDADPEAVETAKNSLADYTDSVTIINDNFANLETICRENNFLPVHGIIFDLGLSSTQLEVSERGFSFQHDGPIDMRYSPAQELTASDIINTFPEDKLSQIIKKYGEDHNSKWIARHIIKSRPINSTLQLASVVEKAIGGHRGKIHPATKTFMALRIIVNHELENLVAALKQTIVCLKSQGRLVVISYHSLEDRIVKQFMQRESKECLCPPGTPICKCDHMPSLRIISKKVITPSLSEIKSNPRSRSAKLRVAERL
ncbi:MAG: 16S rRNA (cytosine(1402)-N(4))-methyltransferase RsmH [Chloroflexota bacterium]|nr:MAG: 16S rRNA (cytosine(1402)-N(4))-methyltransferase RsmH [Chloroflexota bacterium]